LDDLKKEAVALIKVKANLKVKRRGRPLKIFPRLAQTPVPSPENKTEDANLIQDGTATPS
jgi:hypothetical protein